MKGFDDVVLCLFLRIATRAAFGFTVSSEPQRAMPIAFSKENNVKRSFLRNPQLFSAVADERTMTKALHDDTWEAVVASSIRQDMAKTPRDGPYMVALVGIPGSGKSTSCNFLSDALRFEHNIESLVMPFDGYHFPMEQLKQMPNPTDLIYRRGAPDTFDSARLRQDLERLRFGTEQHVFLPGFDHAVGDPEPNAHIFDRAKNNVVLCEGLYLLHDKDGWETIKDLFDYSIFIDIDVDVCVERLKIRNKCIPGYTAAEIDKRCEEVDRVNAEIVNRCKDFADIIVDSFAK